MSGRNNRLAGQIGEYLVCAELGRRGLIATPFAGNVPAFDVLAADEQCRTVPIQVKASHSENWPSDARTWMNIELDPKTGVQHNKGPVAITNPELIYVCVAIAKPSERDRFFILTKADLQQRCIKNYKEWMEKRDWKRPRNPASYDCRYDIKMIVDFENKWDLITRRLQAVPPDPALTDEQETDQKDGAEL